ncbi:MAG: Histidine-tRNA ligase [Microgenomates group bacterium GW2011_GWF2_45_18]|nr:MAG: Histidine-tRNA ligase [Microgenomates group bacterium GW2011_GWF1_44_10]KKU02085.1 MAG: Histidine-tRNA ligase [Microgenomates group bacterium GW2011_GWF2_45_18]HAU98638.1 histidine--tRNA ligase [Candidatus Paceibacterota bacterium]HAX01491.1 histidine--tRNA ligase [Candidatus Paceibacterota bacterium]
MAKGKERRIGNPSGFKDTLPAEKLLFNRLMEDLSQVVESYGFSPIDTPEIEWLDTLRGHDDSGGKLIYRVFNGYENPEEGANLDSVMDKGLRFDLTVPLARFYGQHANELPLPFRRYHWGKVFRGEAAQTGKGRYREFYQFDADTVGATGAMADAETAAMLADAMQKLGLPAVVKINNRRLLDSLVEVGGIDDQEVKSRVFTAIDKFDKIGKEKVVAEIAEATSPEFGDLVDQYLSVSGAELEKIEQLRELLGSSPAAQEALENLGGIISMLHASGYEGRVAVSPEIVRGLGYYTGAIFETYVEGFEQFGSVASGGRYDRLIADLGGPNQPAVGASFGVSRILDVLQSSGWESDSQTPAKVFMVNFSPKLSDVYFSVATELRQNNIPTQVYSDTKKVGQQLKYASELGIPYAILIGEDEHAKGTATIRNLETREQEEVAMSNLVATLIRLLAKE